MSPEGLDVRNFGYGYRDYTITAAGSHEISVQVNNPGNPTQWLVMRIQGFAAAGVALSIILNENLVVAPGGCIELLPGGAWRQPITVSGIGGRIIIEYWYPATGLGNQPGISAT